MEGYNSFHLGTRISMSLLLGSQPKMETSIVRMITGVNWKREDP